MLLLLIAHIIITGCCLWSGFLFYKLIFRESTQRPLIFHLISGLVLLSVFAQLVVLFSPIGSMAQMILGIILLALAVLKWGDFKNLFKKFFVELSTWPILLLILFLLTWIIILFISGGPTIMDDTETYHIQSIKWVQEYGSVPGLVNLHERFGFNSSWFSSVALFSFSPETSGGFTVLNSVVSAWLCYWFISKFNQFRKENNLKGAFAILIIFIAGIVIWPLIRGSAATANYDFITTSIVLILFTEIFFNEKTSPSIEWMTWPVYLFTVRPINFPLLLLSLFAFILFVRQKNTRQLLLAVVYCSLLIIPFLIRNIIIAGYPFYPALYFDFTNVDWKPDPTLTERLLEYIKYYNRVSTTYLNIEQTKSLGSAWVPSWFQYLFLFDKILVLAGLTGILFTGVKLLIQKSINSRTIIMGLMIAWLVCWFIVSPDPRFVYGVLLFGIFLFAYYFIAFIKDPQLIKFILNAFLIFMICGSGYYLVSKPLNQTGYRNWIVPSQLPQPPTEQILLDGIIFRIPRRINNNWNTRCYGTQLPCLYKIDPRLKLRGKNINSGFHLEK